MIRRMNLAVFSTGRIVPNLRGNRGVTVIRSLRAVTAAGRGRNVRAVPAGGGDGFPGGRGHARRALEQAAEILFARVLMFAVGELEIRPGFVADFKPFEPDNADVFVAAFPDLTLLKFHRRDINLSCLL